MWIYFYNDEDKLYESFDYNELMATLKEVYGEEAENFEIDREWFER